MRRAGLPLALLSLLAGCTIVPGMTMRGLPPERPPPVVPGITITAISPASIRDNALIQDTKVDPVLGSQEALRIERYQYRVGPHDILSVTVWEHPELGMPFAHPTEEAVGHLVAEDGTIFFPYVGKVVVAGKTIAEVRDIIRKGLAGTVQDPQVDVHVTAYRSQKVLVLGEVTKPGPLPLTDRPLTVADAISLAGDVTANADLGHVILNRDGRTYIINLLALIDHSDVSQNVLLKNGDMLQIPDRNTQKVFVIGEVAKPSSLVMHKRGMTLTEAIAEVGGVDRYTSDPEHIYVIRGTETESEIYYLNAQSPDALVLGDYFRLMPRDIIYVETAPIARWNRVIEQIVPTTNVIRNLGRITGSQ